MRGDVYAVAGNNCIPALPGKMEIRGCPGHDSDVLAAKGGSAIERVRAAGRVASCQEPQSAEGTGHSVSGSR